MYTYPKPYLNANELVRHLMSKGMQMINPQWAEDTIIQIGYYRLKGYFLPFYNQASGFYSSDTSFEDIVELYHFDVELSKLIFGYILKIEVALRARLIEALAIAQDVTALSNPSLFDDKKKYWENQSSISSEIARSADKFINHQYSNYEGAVPVWAAVEVMQYGTLSKLIKNLKTGANTAYEKLRSFYKYPNSNGSMTIPSAKLFTSWIQATSAMRNICAHGGRIYNRAISAHPEILNADAITPVPASFGAYQEILAMKYLRPDNTSWKNFSTELTTLFSKYSSIIALSKLGFPSDWSLHI